jgi:hypothetical protein
VPPVDGGGGALVSASPACVFVWLAGAGVVVLLLAGGSCEGLTDGKVIVATSSSEKVKTDLPTLTVISLASTRTRSPMIVPVSLTLTSTLRRGASGEGWFWLDAALLQRRSKSAAKIKRKRRVLMGFPFAFGAAL